MKKKFRLYVGFLLMASGVCAMTACSGGEESIANTTGGIVSKTDEVLTLAINTGNVSSRTTDITADPGTTAENTINRITVGIFEPSNNNAVKTIQELTSGDGSAGSGTFSVSTSTGKTVAAANIVTSALSQNDHILVAVNAPAGYFSGVTSESAFAKNLKVGVALTTIGTSANPTGNETSTNIPMYGRGTLDAPVGATFTKNIDVEHLIAKVTLEKLAVDFDENGSYKNATFTPTAFFLINVPDELVFEDTPVWTAAVNDYTTLHHGFSSDTGNHGTSETYLTTKNPIDDPQVLSGNSSSGTATFNKKYFLYTMPSSNADNDGFRTKLVIAGKFKADGSANEEVVYYPVSINATYNNAGVVSSGDKEVYKVYPNKNYKCSVIIKTKGSDDPWNSIDPQTAQITVTVKDFEDVVQTTTFK